MSSLTRCSQKYRDVDPCTKSLEKFDFLADTKIAQDPCDQKASDLISCYPDDLDTNLSSELRQFHAYLLSRNESCVDVSYGHSYLYSIMVEDGIQDVFPNVDIALRIFLTLMITNCTAERSFSQLKKIKCPARNAMTQNRLEALSLCCAKSRTCYVKYNSLI